MVGVSFLRYDPRGRPQHVDNLDDPLNEFQCDDRFGSDGDLRGLREVIWCVEGGGSSRSLSTKV